MIINKLNKLSSTNFENMGFYSLFCKFNNHFDFTEKCPSNQTSGSICKFKN